MAQRELDFWDVVDAGNDFAATEGGMPENQNRTTVNNSARARMGSVRRWYDDPEWLALTGTAVVSRLTATKYRIAGADYTGYAEVGRRVRVQTAGGTPTNVLETFVVASTFTGGNTEIDITPDDSITAGIDEAHFYFGASLRSQAFSMASGGSGFFVPADQTDVGLQAAIDAAEAAGGGIVLLDAARYEISATVNGKTKVQIWGRGVVASELHMVAGQDLDAVLKCTDIQQFRYNDFAINGNRTNQTGGDGHGLHISSVSGGCRNFVIDNVYSNTTLGAGFLIENASASIKRAALSNCQAILTGTDGFNITNSFDTLDALRMANCETTDPGQDGTTVNIAGFRLAGRIAASNLVVTDLNQGGAQNPRGLVLAALQAAEPNSESAEYCTVSGISVSGTATSARGIEVGGHNCSITGGQIVLSGSGSTGVVFDASVPSQMTYRNTLTAVTARCVSGTGFTLPADADDNTLSACTADSCLTGYSVNSIGNHLASCRVYGGGITTVGMSMGAAALNTAITSPHVTGVVGPGITTLSGAMGTHISGGVLDGNTTGIETMSGSMGTVDAGVIYRGNVTDIMDGSGDLLHRGGHPENPTDSGLGRSVRYTVSNDKPSYGTALQVVDGLGALEFPYGGADGKRRYILSGAFTVATRPAAGSVLMAVRIGTAGDITDPVGVFLNFSGVGPHTFNYGYDNGLLLMPAAGALLTVTIDDTNSSSSYVMYADIDVSTAGLDQFVSLEYYDG